MSLISIITFTYNRAHLLQRTLESVLSQTFTDFEYIIVNNGSNDNTDSLLREFFARDDRINIITRPFNDVSVELFNCFKSIILNRNAPYYLVIDDDDFMEQDTVNTLYRLIKDNDADIATVGSMWVYTDGSTSDKFVFEGTYSLSRIEGMMELLRREKINSAQGGKLYRKSLLDYVELPPVRQHRDIHREYRVMNYINKIVVTGKPLYYFYRHDSNSSGLDSAKQITPEKMRLHLEANSIRTEWLTENMPEIADYVLYSELSFMISLYERIHRLDVRPCFDIAQEMKETLFRHSAFLQEHDYCTEREKEILKSMQIMV